MDPGFSFIPETKSDNAKEAAPGADVPAEYQVTLKKAASYSDMIYISKAGIYAPLTSEHGENFHSKSKLKQEQLCRSIK